MVQSIEDARRRSSAGARVPPHDLAAEASLLGAMLLSANAIGAAAEVRLSAADFYKPAHGHIYEAIEALYHRGEAADPVTVSDELHRDGLLDAIGGPATLVALQTGTPAISSAPRYARIVEEMSQLRRLIGVAAEIADLGYSLPDDVQTAIDRAESLVFEVKQRNLGDDMMLVSDLLTDALDKLEALYERGEAVTGVPTGFDDLDHRLAGLQANNLIVVGARPAMGKAQPVDTPVLTPTGWRPIGDISPGDLVIGANGRPTPVLAVHPQGVIPVFRVSLNDGTSTRACADHRWRVQSHADRRAGRRGRVVTTKEILEGLNAGRTRDFHIPVVAPVQHAEIDLPIPPYVLGLLLGDDGRTRDTPVITTADPEVITSIRTALPYLEPSTNDGLSYRLGLGRRGGAANPLTVALRDLGLWGHKSDSKFIPTLYLFAGVEQRLALLQGLMDSDGWCEKFNSLQFASASASLANDVCELVRSLGGTARLRVRSTNHLDSHTVTLRLPRDLCPFRLERKSRRWNGEGKWARPDRRIVAVTEGGEAESVCLTVGADDGLYVTEQHIVTHNTSFALGVLAHAAMEAGVPSLLFSLEMGRDEITQRLLCSEARVDAGKLRTGNFDDRDWQKITAAVGRLAEAPIYIDDNPNVTVMDIRAKARRLKAKDGLGLIIIDYMQLMTGRARAESRQVEVAEMSRSLKILARELEIPVVALSQLSRNLESRQDKRPMLSDLRESGCLTASTRILRADTGAEVTMGELLLTGERNIPVWSLDESLKVVPATMTHVFPSGIKEVFELRLASGRVVEASANHPFRTLSGWTALENLRVGTRLAVPRHVGQPQQPTEWPEAEVVMLAHLIGDGCVASRQPVHYTSADPANLEVVEAAAAHFGITPRREQQGNWWHSYLPSPRRLTHGVRNPIQQWLSRFGLDLLRSWQKFIPAEVFSLSNRQLALFLHHLWSTDGSVSIGKNGSTNLYYGTTSERLARDVQAALLRFEIRSRVFPVASNKGRTEYQTTISGRDDQLRFVDLIGAHGARGEIIERMRPILESRRANTNRDTIPVEVWTSVRERMRELGISTRAYAAGINSTYGGTSHFKFAPSRGHLSKVVAVLDDDAELRTLAESDVYWDTVVAIEPLGPQPVYDATVLGTHNFIANGIVVHNSLEQDADVVMFLYRDEMYHADSPDKGIAEVIVAKHRSGPTGVTQLAFLPQYTRFAEMPRHGI